MKNFMDYQPRQVQMTRQRNMMADTTALNQAVADLATEVTNTTGIEASATALINGFAAAVTKAVTDALTADNAADQGSIDAATAAIAAAKTAFNASAGSLGAAVAANAGA